ncbi:MAG: hypothetical protein Q9174_007066, partial [Haloplaca sp. 1 TL-2023]
RGGGDEEGAGRDTEWENLTQRQWRARLLYSPPTPAILAALSQDAVMEGLAAVEKFMGWRFLNGGAQAVGGQPGQKEGAERVSGRGGYVAAWTWALLARCRDVGEMGSEDVGVLRGVGKRAGGMVRELAAGSIEEDEEDGQVEYEGEGEGEEEDEVVDGAEQEGEEGDGEEGMGEEHGEDGYDADDAPAISGTAEIDGMNGGEQTTDPLPIPSEGITDSRVLDGHTDDMQQAKARLLSSLDQQSTSPTAPSSESNASQNTTPPPSARPKQQRPSRAANAATLDMILTIVGEVFGQRDLLASRCVWD